MMPLRLLFDEHMPPLYPSQLLRLEPSYTVWRIGDPGAPPRGTLDPDLLRWCEEYDFLLVTNNRKSMPVHLADHLAQGRHVPAILTLDTSKDIAVNLEALLIVAGASLPGEYRDRIAYLPFQTRF